MSKTRPPVPLRRYALFMNIFYQISLVVIQGEDMKYAHKWGGFVGWLGGVKEARA